MYYEFRFRRGSVNDWVVKNPILQNGEPGYEEETRKLKIGDGNTPWTSLPYVSGSGGSNAQVFVQDSPSASWVISGTLGRIPNVAVYVGGELVDADVVINLNTVTISFPSPMAGVAVLV